MGGFQCFRDQVRLMSVVVRHAYFLCLSLFITSLDCLSVGCSSTLWVVSGRLFNTRQSAQFEKRTKPLNNTLLAQKKCILYTKLTIVFSQKNSNLYLFSQEKLFSSVFSGASQFTCRDCCSSFDTLVELTVHMNKMNHFRDFNQRGSSKGSEKSKPEKSENNSGAFFFKL